MIGPTGDGQGHNLANYQPAALAAMEAHFDTRTADLVILGQPNVETKSIDNPLVVPKALSFLISRNWNAPGAWTEFVPESEWPTNIALLYYAYHIMVGLGTIFMLVMLLSGIQLWRKKLYETKWLLWVLMLSFPLPFIANTAGWMTAEIGRQPYLVYGVMRTVDGFSKSVSAANVWFTLLGFMGMYTLLAILFLFLVQREINHGPEHVEGIVPAPVNGGKAMPQGGTNMGFLWFAIISVMLTAYVILDGFDMGAGALHLFLGRTDDERKKIIRSIGPVWDGNEVWLLATGGVLYFVFPQLYASSFSGFYLPLMMVLWLLMLRAIGLEFRTHIKDGIWASFSTPSSPSAVCCWRCFTVRRWATWCAACLSARITTSSFPYGPTGTSARIRACWTGTRCCRA